MTEQTQTAPVGETPPGQTPPTTLASTQTPPPESTTTQTPTESTQSTEAKPEAKPDAKLGAKESLASKPGEAEKPAEKIVPEKYETFKAPEGFEITPDLKTELDTTFKDMGLSQEEGQKLVDLYATKVKDIAAKPYTDYFTMRDGWRNDVIKDPVLGNGTDNLNAKVSETISKAIDSLGEDISKPFRQAMDFTGAGDNPAFLRAFYALSQRATEGKHVGGKGPASTGQQNPSGAPRSAAAAIFPNLPTSAA